MSNNRNRLSHPTRSKFLKRTKNNQETKSEERIRTRQNLNETKETELNETPANESLHSFLSILNEMEDQLKNQEKDQAEIIVKNTSLKESENQKQAEIDSDNDFESNNSIADSNHDERTHSSPTAENVDPSLERKSAPDEQILNTQPEIIQNSSENSEILHIESQESTELKRTSWRISSNFENLDLKPKATGGIDLVVFGPKGSWFIKWADNTYAWENLPEDLSIKLLNRSKTLPALRSLSISARQDWIIFYEDGSYAVSDSFPCIKKLISEFKNRRCPKL
jgi:hypothetical protein